MITLQVWHEIISDTFLCAILCVRTLFLNLHVMFHLVSDVEVFCSLLYSFGSFFLDLC